MSDLTPTKEEATAYRAIRKRHKLTIRGILPALLGAIEPESEYVVDFVENLPHVRLGKLPEQVDTCTICQLEFGNETEESDSAACTFLQSQNQNDETDSRYATFVAWSNVVGGANILWAEVYRQLAREVIADLNLFEH